MMFGLKHMHHAQFRTMIAFLPCLYMVPCHFHIWFRLLFHSGSGGGGQASQGEGEGAHDREPAAVYSRRCQLQPQAQVNRGGGCAQCMHALLHDGGVEVGLGGFDHLMVMVCTM